MIREVEVSRLLQLPDGRYSERRNAPAASSVLQHLWPSNAHLTTRQIDEALMKKGWVKTCDGVTTDFGEAQGFTREILSVKNAEPAFPRKNLGL